MLFRTSRKPLFSHHFQCHKKLEPPIRPSPLRGNASASPRFKGTGFASCSPCSQVPLRSTCCAWVRASLDPGRSGRCWMFIGDGRTGYSRLLLRGGSGPRVSVPFRAPVCPSVPFEVFSLAAAFQKGSVALSIRMPSPLLHSKRGGAKGIRMRQPIRSPSSDLRSCVLLRAAGLFARRWGVNRGVGREVRGGSSARGVVR